MNHRFLESYRLDITPLSPLHLGTGESYNPTGYVIDDGTLFAFTVEDAMAACTLDDRKTLLSLVSRRDPLQVLLGVQRFFFERRDRLIARSSHFIPVRKANEDFYKRRVGSETNPGVGNLLDIDRTAYDPVTSRPILPGSGIKGAIRTTLLDGINLGRPLQAVERDPKKGNATLQQRLFGYQAGNFELDPMRLVQIGDACLRPDADMATEIRFALNRKKKRILRDGREVSSQAQSKNLFQVLETVRPLMPRAFQCRLNLQLMSGLPEAMSGNLPRADLRWSTPAIARSCHKFYFDRFHKEAKILEERGFSDPKWMKHVNDLLLAEKQRIDQGGAFLVRIGRHSGAESVTLNGVRDIRIMQGRDRQDTHETEAKTLWLAGDDPNAPNNLLPFGWAFVEVTPEGSEPPPWRESLDAYHEALVEWRKRIDGRLTESRLRHSKGSGSGSAVQAHAGPKPSEPEGTPITDPFLTRLQTFKASEYGQLPQLLKQIDPRADRDACLRVLATRLLTLYGADKRQLKALREKFPALAPYLVKG
jgi:CRISPR-associated protein Csm5